MRPFRVLMVTSLVLASVAVCVFPTLHAASALNDTNRLPVRTFHQPRTTSRVIRGIAPLERGGATAQQSPDSASGADQPMVFAGTGQGAGIGRALSIVDGGEIFSGQPYGAGFTGGVRVAVDDVNGDGIEDLIVGSGPGGGLGRVFSGANLAMLMSFAPFGGYSGGVYVAAGDIDGDGRADVIVGGGGQVAAYSGGDGHEIGRAFPFTPAYQGGVTVAAGDIDGDGRPDVVAGMES